MTKSSLSALIKKLRKKGYLYFEENPEDIRKKKVLPPQKLIDEGNEFLQRADKMESEICSTPESQEKKELWDLERKLLTKLTEMEHRNKKTDRRLYYSEESVRTTETI